jgi:hypothetical protein
MVEGQIVTSERGVVTQVDLGQERLFIEMENGRTSRLGQESVEARLAHGYATTVHRSQGATHDVAHVYEDGGGRELAYVAMSRARETTHLYLVADDLDQAREDLARHWQQERREQWAIDTGTPQPEAEDPELPAPPALQRLALRAERDALAVAIPQSITRQLEKAVEEVRGVEVDLKVLQKERGFHAEGELGKAAGELWWAERRAFDNQRMAANKDMPRSIRREARRHAIPDAELVKSAEERLERLIGAEEHKLVEALDRAQGKVTGVTGESGWRSIRRPSPSSSNWTARSIGSPTRTTANAGTSRGRSTPDHHRRRRSSAPDLGMMMIMSARRHVTMATGSDGRRPSGSTIWGICRPVFRPGRFSASR